MKSARIQRIDRRTFRAGTWALVVLSALAAAQAAHAQSASLYTFDGTANGGSSARVTFGTSKDWRVINASNGHYVLESRKEHRFVLASCWRNGPGGDVAACTTALARDSSNARRLHVQTHPYAGSGSSQAAPAWFSLSVVFK